MKLFPALLVLNKKAIDAAYLTINPKPDMIVHGDNAQACTYDNGQPDRPVPRSPFE